MLIVFGVSHLERLLLRGYDVVNPSLCNFIQMNNKESLTGMLFLEPIKEIVELHRLALVPYFRQGFAK